MPTIAIIGGGLAGAKTAEALREQDFDGDVQLFCAEEHLPYERPPLSKEFLAGKKTLPDFTVHHPDWYRDNRIDLHPGTRVAAIDTGAHTLTLPDGTEMGYDSAVLATGSRSRTIDIPGADAAGVHTLRTIDDARALDEAITEGSRVGIIGGGWIGLEVAAGARERGAQVTIVEAASTTLLGSLGAEVGAVFADLHRAHGVDLRTSTGVAEILVDSGRACGLRLSDDAEVPADIVLVAVGAISNVELARDAGLDVADGGVVVDASLRSSDPDVYAVGDIANAQHPTLGRRVRTEHWANALNQPAVAVRNILGKPTEYTNLPYFFTDQYDLGMEYAGLADPGSPVVFRGDVAGREFLVFWLDDDQRVRAGMQVNIWDQLDGIKALIAAGTPVDAAALADPAVALDTLA